MKLSPIACITLLIAVTAPTAFASDCLIESSGDVSSAVTGFGINVKIIGDLNGDGHDDFAVGATTFESPGALTPGQVSILFGGPSLDDVADVVLTGEANGDRFGFALAPAGDFNGDGFVDILVGAYQNDANGSQAGRAYLYFGGPGLDSQPDMIFTGEASGDNFGLDVDGVGDVNGDGHQDLLISARLHSSVGYQKGRAYVYFGGPAADTTPDLILNGQVTRERFGFTVSGGGDVNGDGQNDFSVGAYHNSVLGERVGRVYVYFGGSGVDTVADLVLDGEAPLGHFGDALNAGDVNGDGNTDILVGASQMNGARGRAYVFLGGSTLDATVDLVLNPASGGEWFGRFVDGGGDLNGDGYGDLLVGAPAIGSGPGRAYIFYGGPGLDAVPEIVLIGEAWGDRFGSNGALSGGDVDGDGDEDLLVGGPENDHAGANVGRAYLYSGGTTGGAPDLVINPFPQIQTTNLGVSVAIPGDLTGDGFPDFVAGATTFGALGAATPGHVLLYAGGPLADGTAELILSGEANGDRFGFDLGPAGDFNADGDQDLIVGAYQNDGNGIRSGRAYVYFGGPGLGSAPDLILTGEDAGDEFGIAVDGIGDVNDDGHDDVLVGARMNTEGGVESGRAYVFYGGPGVDDVPDLVLESHSAGERFGFTVSGAGDVNGDGHEDFMVGAYFNPSAGERKGRTYVYFGGPGVDAQVDLMLTGEANGDHFSDGLDRADVNGDGYSDILVGASQKDGANGRVYVYFGGPGVDSQADMVLDSKVDSDWFGRFLSGGGDLNHDGFGDLMVGAPEGNQGSGRVYVYYGGPILDDRPDAFVDGEAYGDGFGLQVSGTGQDVDGNGIDDLLIGAYLNDSAGSDAGRVYLYLCLPPSCDQASVFPSVLRPPNHQLVPVTVTGLDDPELTVELLSVTSDEPPGSHCPDAIVSGSTVELRAERSGKSNGRVYNLTLTAVDENRMGCFAYLPVCVPHSRASSGGGRTEVGSPLGSQHEVCVDDGGEYDPTDCTAVEGLLQSEEGQTFTLGRTTEGWVQVRFALPEAGAVDLVVVDVTGRLVRRLVHEEYRVGEHTVLWKGSDSRGRRVPGGVYFMIFRSGNTSHAQKVVLID